MNVSSSGSRCLVGGEGMLLTLFLSLPYGEIGLGGTDEALTEDLFTAILGPK